MSKVNDLFPNNLCKYKNSNIHLLPEEVINQINIYRGEGYIRKYILSNLKDFWNRYIVRILGEKALNIIINPEINKCLCRYLINNRVKVYHYKSRYIKLFTNYPIEDVYEKNREDMYLEDFMIKFKVDKIDKTDTIDEPKDKVYFYISFIANLDKFMIKNKQNELDKELHLAIVDQLRGFFINNKKIQIYYKPNEFFNNKMRLIVELNFQELSTNDYIKYKDLFMAKNKIIDIKELCKEFLKEKIYENLLL